MPPHIHACMVQCLIILLRSFGCVCFVLLPSHEQEKLSPKTNRCIFVGYSLSHKGYMSYDPMTRRLCIARHVSFLENVSYFKTSSSPQNSYFLQTSSESSPIPVYAPATVALHSDSPPISPPLF